MRPELSNTKSINRLENERTIYVIDNIDLFVNAPTNGRYHTIICRQPLNDFKHINRYLRKIHASLKPHGILIGRVETLEQRKKRLALHHGRHFYRLIVIYEFFFKRVLPRLLVLRPIYRQFRILGHRLISKCEALGRLKYCGFDIVTFSPNKHDLCFIMRKNALPLKGKPHDGILIKIPKVGRGNKTIYCYKLRTMHAYADYLHDFVLSNYKLDSNGKVTGDFRKTGWGRLIRKTWLDEIPQLYNILKGDLSFIGLRPLSPQFLALYPKEWREMRQKTKPGFVPPYYADCPKTFEDIIESEKHYSELKRRHPFSTDVVYFIKVVYSFLVGKARTG